MTRRRRCLFCTLFLILFISVSPAQNASENQGFPLQLTVVEWQSDHDMKKEKTSFGVFFYDPGKMHKLGEKQFDISNFKELLDLLKIEHGFRDLRPKMAGLYSRLGNNLVEELSALAGNLQADETQRKRALIVLKTIGPNAKSAIPSIVNLLSGSLGIEARDVLVAIGHSAVPALVTSLKDLDREQTRLAAAQALTQIGPAARDAYEALFDTAKKDWNPEVRAISLEALVKLKAHREKTDEALIQASQDDEPRVRVQVLKLLSERYRTEQNVAVAIKALEDPDVDVRKAAVELVRDYGGSADEAIPKLGMMASKDPDPGIRLSAIKALSDKGLKVTGIIENLSVAVTDVEMQGQIACEAIELLNRLGPKATPIVNVVVEALRHPNKNVRSDAARFLANFLEVPKVKAALQAAEADDEESVRSAVKEALQGKQVERSRISSQRTRPSRRPERRPDRTRTY